MTGRPNVIEGCVSDWRNGIAIIETVGGVSVTAVCRRPLNQGEKVLVFVMPEDIVVSKTSQRGSARNVLKLRVEDVEDKGPLKLVKAGRDGLEMGALITRGSYGELGLKVGDQVYMQFKASAVRVVPLKG